MAIHHLDQDICTGCGICIAVCPQDVLRMDEASKKATITYPLDCVACWGCEFLCPVGCIEVSEPRPKEVPSPY